MDSLFDRLAAPFDPDKISWRVGSTTADKTKGMALAYIDARDVMERLDEVCGPENWQCKYSHANGKTVCDIGIRIDRGDDFQEWVWKADGAGDTDYEAEKGALSDAFKRAAVRWGVGRYLYGMSSPWVEVEQRGRSYVVKEGEYRKLEDMLVKYTTEFEWGSPESRATLRVLLSTVKTCLHTADDVRLWREANEGTMAQMRVKARAKLDEELNRVTDAYQAKAA